MMYMQRREAARAAEREAVSTAWQTGEWGDRDPQIEWEALEALEATWPEWPSLADIVAQAFGLVSWSAHLHAAPVSDNVRWLAHAVDTLAAMSPQFPVLESYALACRLEAVGHLELARVEGSKNATWRIVRVSRELDRAVTREVARRTQGGLR